MVVVGSRGWVGWRRGIPGSTAPARGQRPAIRKGAKSWITQFAAPPVAPSISSRPVRPLRLLSFLSSADQRSRGAGRPKRSGIDGVQLRRYHRRGGHVPQHDPHGGRGVVPARDEAELLVRVVRGQPGRRGRRRRQVRLRAGHARRVLQVPPPPHQRPGPRPAPPVPSDLPGRRLYRAATVVHLHPHR